MSENITERFSAYVVIPAPVFFDREISDRARLLYGLIASMCHNKGYCWARNETIARYLGTESDRTVRRLLGELKDRGYIAVEQSNTGGNTVRKIYLTFAFDGPQNAGPDADTCTSVADRPDKNDRPPGQICPPRPDKNDRQNNINNNNTPYSPPNGGRRRDASGKVILTQEQELSFADFWAAYPSGMRRDKQKARELWKRLDPDPALQATILAAIAQLKATAQWQDGKAPYPSTFLRNRRWEDAEELDMPQAQNDDGRNHW